MPKNVPAELEDKFKACKEKVMAQGNDEDAAYGICYMSVVEGKSLDEAFKAWGETKIGARNSKEDQKRVQLIHDYAKENGAMCGEYEGKSVDLPDPENTLINFGSEVKSLKGLQEPDYAVIFGGNDLSNDYFDKNTEFGFAGAKTKRVPILFHHALPLETKGRRKYQETAPIGEAELEIADEGVLIKEAILYNRKKYEEYLSELGWSSGAASHAVVRVPSGEKNYVKQWLLGELSITPTSAEPRLKNVVALKSLITSEEQGAGARSEGESKAQDNPMEGNKMSEELNIEKIVADASAKAADEAVKKFADALPETKSGFAVQVTTAAEDQPFESIAEQMKAVKAFATSYGRQEDPRLKRLAEVKAPLGLNEGVPSQGGFLLDPQFSDSVLTPAFETGAFTRFVNRMPTSKNFGYIKAVDETDLSSGQVFGGVQSYWRPEAGSVTATKPKFRRVNWELKGLEVLMYVTDEELEDAPLISRIAQESAGRALDFKLNEAILRGVGNGMPLGVINSPAFITVTRTDANTVLNADILAMWQRLHPAHRANAAWFINSEVEPKLDQLYLTTSLEARYITYGADGVMKIKGKPVYVTEFNSALGTAGDIVLANMNDYMLFQRDVKSSVNPWLQWLTSENAFKWELRVDGMPATYSAVTPAYGTLTQSPYIGLLATS